RARAARSAGAASPAGGLALQRRLPAAQRGRLRAATATKRPDPPAAIGLQRPGLSSGTPVHPGTHGPPDLPPLTFHRPGRALLVVRRRHARRAAPLWRAARRGGRPVAG